MISINKSIKNVQNKKSNGFQKKKNGTVTATGILLSLTLVFAFVSSSSSGSGFLQAAHAATAPTGIMVPLYMYPGSAWTTVANVKTTYPNVPILAVVNPDNGPGSAKDVNFVNGIANLQKAGVQVIGYVPTGYGQRSIFAIKADVSTWKSFYPSIKGIFFDEMTNEAGSESLYQSAHDFAASQGFTYTVGNPGAVTSSAYISTESNVVFYEDSGVPNVSSLDMQGFTKSHFSVIAYGVSSLPSLTTIKALAAKAQWISFTNDVLDDPYDTLPSYLAAEAKALNSLIVSTTSVTLTVKALDQNGNAVNGMYVEVHNSAGSLVKSGYTPLQVTVNAGQTYTVTVDSSFNGIIFGHWNNGSTSTTRTVTMGSTSGSVTAYYND